MPQSTDELKQRIDAISTIFKGILNDNTVWGNLTPDKRTQLITGVNKSYGQALSFVHEFTTTKAAEIKRRDVETQTYADVTVGEATALFAKSIECKSVTKPEKGAVNKVIGDAIEQLGGTTGHNPRGGDVRIVDIKIDGNCNPWPIAGGAYGTARPMTSLATIKSQAQTEILGIINTNKAGAGAVRRWLAGEQYEHGVQSVGRLKDVETTIPNPISQSQLPPSVTKLNPNSTRPVYQAPSGHIHKIRCLTIKIRYNEAYLVDERMPPNQMSGLSEIVIQCYKKPTGSLAVETAKIKKVIYDFSNINNITATVMRS